MANVLVIDDDEDIARLLQTQLTEEGHSVAVAHQGDEGMAKALKMKPDLIMLDVFLPDATGFQICTQIRKNASTHSIPVIMMTGAARFPSQHMFGMERGANEYISKPFDIVELGELVHKYIGNHRPAAEEPAQIKMIDRLDDLSALSSFLEQSGQTAGKNGDPHHDKAAAPVPHVPRVPHVPPVHPVPPVVHPAAPSAGFVPAILASKERFIDFGMEIYALASRLSSTHAERFLADQLLRAGLSVGRRLTESRSIFYKGPLRTCVKRLTGS